MPDLSITSITDTEKSNREKFKKERFFIDLRFADFINHIREQFVLSLQNKRNKDESMAKKESSNGSVQFGIASPTDRRVPTNSIEFAFMKILRETADKINAKINEICETSVKNFINGINASVNTGTLTAVHANVATRAIQQTFNNQGGTAQISQQAFAYSTASSAPSLEDIYKTRPNLDPNFRARVSKEHSDLVAVEKENKHEGGKFVSGMEFFGFLTFAEQISMIAREEHLNTDSKFDTIFDMFYTHFNKQHFAPIQVIMHEGYSSVSTYANVSNFHRALSNGTTSFEEVNGFTLTKPPAHFATITMDYMKHQSQPQPNAPTIEELDENTFGNS